MRQLAFRRRRALFAAFGLMLLGDAGLVRAAKAQTFKMPPVVVFDGKADKALEDTIAGQLKGRIEGGRLVVDADAPTGEGLTSSTSMPDNGRAAVYVDVAATFPPGGDGKSGPGLAVRYSTGPDGPSLYSLVRTQSGYLITAWEKGIPRNVISASGSLKTLSPGQPVRLAARETRSGTAFLVNGKQVAVIPAGRAGGHDVGLISLGTGRFAYDNYAFNSEGRTDAIAPAPTANKPVAEVPDDDLSIDPAIRQDVAQEPVKPEQPQPRRDAAGGGRTVETKHFDVPPVVVFDGKADKAFEDFIAQGLKGRVEAGQLVVDAEEGPGLISSTTVSGDGKPAVYVDVAATFPPGDDERSGPGLVVRFSNGPNGPSFHSLTRTRSGYLIQRWKNGVGSDIVSTSSSPNPLAPDQPMRLAARETGNGIAFLVNGVQVASLSAEDADGHEVGLTADGTGRFTYDNYGPNGDGRTGEGEPAPMADNKPGARTPTVPDVQPATAKTLPLDPGGVPERQRPPPLPDNGSDAPIFWIGENGQPVGPLSAAQLRQRVAAGTLARETLVWMEGMAGWEPASTVPAIAALLGSGPAPVPATPRPTPDAPVDVSKQIPLSGAQTDAAQFMLGNWMLESQDVMDGVGPVTIRLNIAYAANRTVNATGTVQPQGQFAFPVVLTGNWAATAAGPGRFRFDFSGTMTINNGPGQPPRIQPVSESSTVTILDQDTIRTESGDLQRRVRP